MNGLTGRRWWLACLLVLFLALAATVPTAGDLGMTYDEPAYRYSQQISVEWWERWGQVRSRADIEAQLNPEELLYYWPYGRYGINFHPPLAGQLNLLTYEIFGHWMKDIPARRMASVLEYSLTITILFGFLASRYGAWVGLAAAGSLLAMPRVYGDGHIAGTDMPGLFLWAVTTVAFWKGLHDPHAGRWRILGGILLGLAFVEKMGAVLVLVPIVVWLLGRLPRTFVRRDCKADWVDGFFTTSAMLLPLGLAFLEIRRLSAAFLRIQRALGFEAKTIGPARTDLFRDHPQTSLPAIILLAPLLIWIMRRLLARVFRSHPVWGAERPALETWLAILAFAPAVGWLGNPAWWRETLPRLAHYYAINTTRRGVLPDIQILYFGQTYEYSLPWHNAWVLMAITVPAAILAASIAGLAVALLRIRSDRLPLFFLVNMVVLPVARMFETPSHDGVRLFLPTFFFLAAFAGWGVVWLADGLAGLIGLRAALVRCVLAGMLLGSAAWQLIKIHPYELSYYNELIGGPRGAWKRGFELTYWYDAFNDQVLAELNARFPHNAHIQFAGDKSAPVMLFPDLQSLGKLRKDIQLGGAKRDEFPYMWLLTHDSKASAFTRLLFAMKPWYAHRPRQLDGLRVVTVADPKAVARAWALQLLTDAADRSPPDPPAAPAWVRANAPSLARFWGDGVTKVRRLSVNEPFLEWVRAEPDRVLAAAQAIAAGESERYDPDVRRLIGTLTRYDQPKDRHIFSEPLLHARPEALVEAVKILIDHPVAVRKVLRRHSYTDPDSIGGYLDRDL